MCESISYPLITAMLATGRIRNYQLVVGGLQMMNLPVSYFFLRFGAIPETVLIVAIVISQFCFASRLYMLRGMIGLKILDFLKKVYSNVIIVSLLSAIIPIIIAEYINEDFLNFILLSIISIFITIVVEFYIGCSSNERKFVIAKIKQIIHKKI